ncbi:DUF885 domain-containing protein [Cupriavidus basilensis]|uniref:DUF885 domain-containing protein n=1 Tax=Cupriavidus basilensis TaxID=68895 RepID=A0ABT6AJF8_9BURK|nr:DUF885 domain-containing protein [Cupriavidus basilensis]MDF3832727.1 DUF885 domain-containing protein [Cupriavidus basilensis]
MVKHRLAWLALALATTGCTWSASSPSGQLDRLFRSYANDTAPYNPFSASDSGVRKYDSVFANDLSEEYRRNLTALCRRYLTAVKEIPQAELSRQEILSVEIFRRRLDECIEQERFRWYLMPINPAGGWPAAFPVIGSGKGSHPFKTVRNYEDFLKRIDGFVVWTDTAIANMREGMRQEMTQPRDLMIPVLAQLEAQIVKRADLSMFYQPIRQFPSDFDEASRNSLTVQYSMAIESKLIPAYQRLRTFIRDEYLPACRTSAGIGALPGGNEMYRSAVKRSTTLDLEPDQIYRTGQAEVQRIQQEIHRLRTEIIASGEAPLPAYTDAESLLAAYRETGAKVNAVLSGVFGRLPTTGYEIRAIEAYRQQSMSSSYIFPPTDGSRPGIFYLNAASVYGGNGSASVSQSLFLHEVVPGHHMQIALQIENKSLPLFRRKLWYSAFGEGWALYAESLGSELGVYATRHDQLDMLQQELLRSARLVVDVGLHEKGWTKQEAIDYLHSHGGGSDANTRREVERYMSWPGQALSYKIGQLKILALRDRAQARLGHAFDIREFHDEVLKDGVMPLDLLERKMDQWIAARQKVRGESSETGIPDVSLDQIGIR